MLFSKLAKIIKTNLIGFFALGLYIVNSMIWFVLVLPITAFYIIPACSLRFKIQKFLEAVPSYWIFLNTRIQNLTIPNTRFILKQKKDDSLSGLSANEWYLLISNHQSWVDILVLERLFNKRIPLLKFFLKSTLFWTLPVLSWFCWIVGFPFIQRYSKKQMAQNPSVKIRNFTNIKKVCEKSSQIPTTITNFVEGRRLTPKLHQLQHSPYKHLLRPHAGGFALSVSALHQKLDKIINITIIYSSCKVSFWDFLCGRIDSITVYSEMIAVTPDLVGDYQQDEHFQLYIKNWLNKVWAKKDLLIENKGSEHEWLSYEI